MGACYACVLKVPESETVSQRVCEDGPVSAQNSLYYKEKIMTTNRLQVSLPGLDLKNPIIPASGCFWFLDKSMPSTMILDPF